MSDLNTKLIGKSNAKGMTFDQLLNTLNGQLQKFTQNNNILAKKADSENDSKFLNSFPAFRTQMHEEMNEMQSNMGFLGEKAKTTQQKNSMKKMKDNITLQVSRFGASSKKIINSSFAKRIDDVRRSSIGSTRTMSEKNSKYMSNIQEDIEDRRMNGSIDSDREPTDIIRQKSMHNQWLDDVELERQIIEERQEAFNDIEADIDRVNNNFNEMGRQILDQGEQLTMIEENVIDTNQNAIAAEKEMNSAQDIQKNTSKKYIVFALIILMALAATLAIILTAA